MSDVALYRASGVVASWAAELFSYLAAFVTIILGVAMSDLILSTHRLIRNRHRLRWDGRPLLFAGTVTIAVVSEFFSLWSRMAVDHLSLLHLLWLLATPFVFALLAYSALPDECPADGLDLTEFYQREHRPWAVLFGLTLVLDIARSADIYLVSPQSFFGYVTATGPFLAFITASLVMIHFGRSRFWSWLGLLSLFASLVS